MENISVEEIKDVWPLTFQIIVMDLLYPWVWSLDTNPWWIFRGIQKHTQLAILVLEAFLHDNKNFQQQKVTCSETRFGHF